MSKVAYKRHKQGPPKDMKLRAKVFAMADKGHLQKEIADAVGLTQGRISILLKERDPGAWNSMSSAPRDGTSILGAWKMDGGPWAMGVTRWIAGRWHLFPDQSQPVRWMHLPQAPKL